MSPDRIRTFLERKPFHPFTVVTGDGDRVAVKSPEMTLLAPGGRTLVVFTGKRLGDDDEMQVIDVFLVTKVLTGAGNGRPRRSRA